MKQILLKSATIILFLSLIIVYIAFRSGYFGGEKSTVPVSPNGSALNNQTPYIKDSNYVKRKIDSATFAIISSKSMVIAPEVSELILSFGEFNYLSFKNKKDSTIQINKAEIAKEEIDLLENSRIEEKDRIKNFIIREKESRNRIPSSKLSSSKSFIMSSEIIEVLKKDTSDKDSIIKK